MQDESIDECFVEQNEGDPLGVDNIVPRSPEQIV